MWTLPLAVGPALILVFASMAASQSLADVARAEEARRKSVKGTSQVYTNESLRGADGGAPPAPPVVTSTTAADKPAAPATEQPAAPATPKDEGYWRDRITQAREELKRSQALHDALQSQISSLYAEFIAKDDPAQRTVLEQKRLVAIAEQDRIKGDITKHTKAIADIEDEARRVNVPSGWLR